MNKDVRTLVYAAIKGMTLTHEQWYGFATNAKSTFISLAQPLVAEFVGKFPQLPILPSHTNPIVGILSVKHAGQSCFRSF